MSENILDLSNVYSPELFHPINNLTKLDIRRNIPRPIVFVTDYNYPDNAFGILTELSFLAIDMMPLPHFGSGFGQMTTLKELHFDSCYLVRLSNETFQRFSSSVEQLTLRHLDMMKNLKTMCVENLDLSEDGIVDYEPGSLFSFVHSECLRHISFKGNSYSLIVEREVWKCYQYDVYISYEGDIVIWIKNVLIQKLETEWGLTMCIKDRDFLSGPSQADNEAESIKNSRSIIFLITP
ncbi:uncharacterized protein LOC134683538 [Mytilus trossulus]|uniref:uncharacterized protein LOC134683538 n=1 Tax=Mytilus trossulus TaxID=6551 RepID=UPI003003EFB0